jgi:hypothetical protein
MEAKIVSLDLGNGFVKARSAARSVSYPSVISVMSQSIEFDLFGSDDFVIGYDGHRFAIGETVHFKGLTPVTISHRSRIGTDFYKTIFASALAATVKTSAVISPVVSLPPAAYWDKEKQKEALAGVYEVEVADGKGKFKKLTYTVPYENIRVIPEGVGTVCMFVLDENGNEIDDTMFKNVIGIIDVGTYTTDLIQLDRLKLVRRGTDSIPHALHDIHTKLRNLTSTRGYDLDVHKADEVLRQGWYRQGGLRIGIDKEVEEWAKQLSQLVSGAIRSNWNGGDDVDFILVTGGGGGLVYNYLADEFKLKKDNVKLQNPALEDERVFIVEDAPHFANAEGGYRYGLLREKALEHGKR